MLSVERPKDLIEIPVDEMDIVFISYDEPQKEERWSELTARYPFAKRVDGVKGFDAAHKAAAELAETERFITVDGDTSVNGEFFSMVLRYPARYQNHIFAWASRNEVNGLVYGNGSLKCWVRERVFQMNTHESSIQDEFRIEFCWGLPYLSMRDCYSVTRPAASPFHAFRAGLREGVKMSLDRGQRLIPEGLFDRIWPGNAQRLLTWASIGADHPYGAWCIYGARQGIQMAIDPEWDLGNVADYDWFDQFWNEKIKPEFDVTSLAPGTLFCPYGGFAWEPERLVTEIKILGDKIYDRTGMSIPMFSQQESKFLKERMNYQEPETEKILFPGSF